MTDFICPICTKEFDDLEPEDLGEIHNIIEDGKCSECYIQKKKPVMGKEIKCRQCGDSTGAMATIMLDMSAKKYKVYCVTCGDEEWLDRYNVKQQ